VKDIIALLVANHCLEVHNSAGPAKDQWLMNLIDRFEVQYKKEQLTAEDGSANPLRSFAAHLTAALNL
jgi:hypothetical protein